MTERTEHTVTSLMSRITPRDLSVLSGVYEHQTLDTHQIARVCFADTHPRRARRRLLVLHRYGVLDRFRRYTARGKLPDYWVLTPLGAELVSYHQGTDTAARAVFPDQAVRLMYSPQIHHVQGLAECFVRFSEAARSGPGELARWFGEAECARRWGQYIRPDAYLRWRQDGLNLRAFLEYDTGSESLATVCRKMRGYQALFHYTERPSLVLFVVHSGQRESHLVEKLVDVVSEEATAYVTTHARVASPGPDQRVWRAPGAADRVRLVDLMPSLGEAE
ncbi:replication-relaxation family protein [Nocardiopsis protaetiae]|uniref:replication-relaxation family protein n=1 Tax=Nocardiopsis protaetiae TaxID=3382270 RepID=UPI00387B296E